MNKNIIQEIRELVSPAEREKARMGFEGYPNEEEIRRLRTTIENGIILAQQRLDNRYTDPSDIEHSFIIKTQAKC